MSAISTPSEWLEFLKQYATAAGAVPWLGNSGVSEEKLMAVETKLKVALPPSYRAFLQASNGWKYSSQTAPELRPVERIKWFRKEHKDWFEGYQVADGPLSVMEQDYFNYAKPCGEFEVKHLGQSLCISEIGDDAVVLLNPMVVWPDGEWETWFFANWIPGAIRYRSFVDWMRQELNELNGQTFEHSLSPGELPTVYLDPPNKPTRRIRPREEVLTLETLLERLKSKKDRERIKASQQLRFFNSRQSVEALLNALRNDSSSEVRYQAADSLCVLGPAEAVEPLIAAIDDPMVNTTAIHALKGFKDERSAEVLLKILESASLYSTIAAHVLAERGDARAVKYLLDFLLAVTSQDKRVQHIGGIAGRLLVNYQDAGFAALEPLMAHLDLEIRKRAYPGIGDLAFMAKNKVTRRKAFELLQRCVVTETDEELRRWMEVSIEISAKKNRG